MAETLRSEYIQGLAWLLFDQTKSLHELDESNRQVLGMAVLMIDDRENLTKKQALKVIHRTAKENFGDGLKPEDEQLLPEVVALQADLIKPKDILASDLSPVQQRAVLTLAALLKISVGLDTSGTQSTRIVGVQQARDEIWIMVAGDQIQVDGEGAETSAKLWEKIGYPKISVLESEKAQRILESHTHIPELGAVLPTDTLAEAGRKVMSEQFQAVIRYEDGVRNGDDIEALHDMRVATRRLRAAFRVFGSAYRSKKLKPLLKHLQTTGRALGEVRDLDVFIEKAQNYMEKDQQYVDEQTGLQGAGGLESLLKHWERQRDQARLKLFSYLDSKEYKTFKDSFITFLNTPDANVRHLPKGNPTPNLVCELVPELVYEHLAIVRAYDKVIPGAPLDQLHALRIEFKRLRYTVEYFKDVLGPQAGDIIDEFKNIQDHLGDLNDARVAIQILQDFLKAYTKKSKNENPLTETELNAISTYLEYRAQERDQLQSSFPELWTYFNRPKFRQDIAAAISVL